MSLELIGGVARVGVGCAIVWAVARRWAAFLDPSAVPSERAVLAGLLSAWIVTLVVAGLGAIGLLGAAPILVAVAAIFAGTRLLRPERPPPILPPPGPERRLLLWPVLLAAPILLWDLGWRLPAPPTNWDALTYHLYLPVRWLQAGALFHVPTVFGDPAAAFAPQNGGLLFTWWIALLGGDSLTNVVNVLPAVVLGLAIYRLAVRSGVGAENAAFAGVALFWTPPGRESIFSATVDLPMLAFWGASLLLIARTFDAKQPASCWSAGLATGLAAGTKVVGLSLIGPQALLAALRLLWRRELGAFAGFLAACLAGGGWWFVVNTVQYGNPLFPLDLNIGGIHVLSGAIPWEALKGQFHVPLRDLVGRVLPHFYGWSTAGLTLVGFVALLITAARPSPQRPVRLLVSAVAVYWALFYFFRMPHNTETRFFLPVVILALIGWAWLIEPLQRRGPWLMRSAWALTFAVLCIDIERQPHWRATLTSPMDAGIPLLPWSALVLATGIAFTVAVFARSRMLRRAAGVGSIALLAALIGLAQHHESTARETHYANSRFRHWVPAIRQLDRLDPHQRQRIAYTGMNLPHTLTGPLQRRPVRYVNTQGALEDGLHDFWSRTPMLARSPKPGLYRGRLRDDYAQWIENLEAAEIQWLAVFRLRRHERYIVTDDEGFPIERAWAAGHPDRFQPIASGRTFALFRFLPR